jgi:hypothetical protein
MAAVLLVVGCAAALPPAPAVRRWADGDPDRFAWFCVIGRAPYNTAAALQSENVRRR